MNTTTSPTPLTDADRQYAQVRRNSALWYGWGVCDALSVPDPDLGWAFSIFAEAEALAYRAGTSSFLSSVPDQWKRFCAALKELS